MGKCIYMTNGFLLTIGNKELFYKTDKKNVTKQILDTFIDKIGEIKNLSSDFIERCKNDERTLKDTRYRISKATSGTATIVLTIHAIFTSHLC